MKESLVSVLTGLQSLAPDDSREKPVDRLHALGCAQRTTIYDHELKEFIDVGRAAHLCSLGTDLIAFKYAHRAESHWPAIVGLSEALAWRNPRFPLKLRDGQRSSVARWAVQEWVINFCPSCSGKGEIPDHSIEGLEGRQPMKPCQTCAGTGLRRYDDNERREALGDLEHLERGLSVAHDLIGKAERLAVRTAKELLERWPPAEGAD